jgi:hypothetical protein
VQNKKVETETNQLLIFSPFLVLIKFEVFNGKNKIIDAYFLKKFKQS